MGNNNSILLLLVRHSPNRIPNRSRIMTRTVIRMITRSLLHKYTQSSKMIQKTSKTSINSRPPIRLPLLRYTPNRRMIHNNKIINRSTNRTMDIKLLLHKYTQSNSHRMRIMGMQSTWSRCQRYRVGSRRWIRGNTKRKRKR